MASLTFSLKAVIVKYAFNNYEIDEMTLLLMRVILVLPMLIITLFVMEGKKAFYFSKKDALSLSVMGVIGIGVSMLGSFYCYRLLGASLGTLTIHIYPALTIILLFLVFKEQITFGKILALVITFIGLMFVLKIENLDFVRANSLGVTIAFATALAFSIYNLLMTKAIKETSPIRTLTIAMIFMVTSYLIVFGYRSYPTDIGLWGLALLLAIVATYLPFLFNIYAIQKVGAGVTVIFGSLGPASTVLLSFLILGETLEPIQLFGMILIIAGIMAVKIKLPNRKERDIKEKVS